MRLAFDARVFRLVLVVALTAAAGARTVSAAATAPAVKAADLPLCKLLLPTAGGDAPSAAEAKDALKAIGPAGATAAVAAAKADLFARRTGDPGGADAVTKWLPVLTDLAPAQALVDAVADRNAEWAEACALALAGQVRADPRAALAARAALAKSGPKLAAGWTRAATAAAPPDPKPAPAPTAAAVREPTPVRVTVTLNGRPVPAAGAWPERRGR